MDKAVLEIIRSEPGISRAALLRRLVGVRVSRQRIRHLHRAAITVLELGPMGLDSSEYTTAFYAHGGPTISTDLLRTISQCMYGREEADLEAIILPFRRALT